MVGVASGGAAVLESDERAEQQGSEPVPAVCLGPVAIAEDEQLVAAVQAELLQSGRRTVTRVAHVFLPAGFAAVFHGRDYEGAVACCDSFWFGRVYVTIVGVFV